MSDVDRERAREIARGVLDGEIDIVSGCRRILPYRSLDREIPDEVWDAILAIDSETDDLPLGRERDNWDPAALAGKTAEVEAYVERIRPAARQTFAEILATLDR